MLKDILKIPFFTITVVVLIVLLAIRIRSLQKKEEERESDFWARERKADLTPNRDLSHLSYITIPVEKFPLSFFEENPDEEADMIIDELNELSKTRLLNLNGKSNTDLKLEYGRGNLEEMQQIGDRFSRVTVLLVDLSKCLMEHDKYEEAAQILEYGVSIGSDISSDYTLLGECYKKAGHPEKIAELKKTVDGMDFMMKPQVLRELDSLQ